MPYGKNGELLPFTPETAGNAFDPEKEKKLHNYMKDAQSKVNTSKSNRSAMSTLKDALVSRR